MVTPKPPTPAQKPASYGSRIVLGIILLACLAFFLLFFVLAFGQVRGQEFSPDTLALRRFSYTQIPLINLQVTPPNRSMINSPLTKYWKQQGFDESGGSNPSTRWDVVIAVGSRLNYVGDADLIRAYLVSENDDGDNPWVVWSEENPKLARVIWPEVLKAIRNRQYVAIPRMLEMAKTADSREQLQSDLEAFQAKSASWLAELDAAAP